MKNAVIFGIIYSTVTIILPVLIIILIWYKCGGPEAREKHKKISPLTKLFYSIYSLQTLGMSLDLEKARNLKTNKSLYQEIYFIYAIFKNSTIDRLYTEEYETVDLGEARRRALLSISRMLKNNIYCGLAGSEAVIILHKWHKEITKIIDEKKY